MTAVCYLLGAMATIAAVVLAAITLAIYRELEIERKPKGFDLGRILR